VKKGYKARLRVEDERILRGLKADRAQDPDLEKVTRQDLRVVPAQGEAAEKAAAKAVEEDNSF
jgi:hypothetical protein